MSKFMARLMLTSLTAATLLQAGPPKFYRLALIQVAYKDKPAQYSVDQLKAAATEISNYYARISYLQFNLQITVSSVMYTPPPCLPPSCIFPLPPVPFVLDGAGNAHADPSDNIVIQHLAELTHSTDHIDFSAIDGIAILNSFSAGDYFSGDVIVDLPSPVVGSYETAMLFENPIDPHLSAPGPSRVNWGTWAFLIGKMIEYREGTPIGFDWDGYPSGGGDGYALMDNCWPCAAGAYSVIGTTFMSGAKTVFNGWLPDSQVVVDADDFTSKTFTLTPLADLVHLLAGDCPSCKKVIKVPITPGYYYLVEARARTEEDGSIQTVDGLPNKFSRGGLWDEGIHITRVNESAYPPVRSINPCDSLTLGCVVLPTDSRFASCNGNNPVGFSVDSLPPYCWPYRLFQAGQTFVGEHGIQISYGGRTGDQFSVNVTRGPVFTAPDVRVVRRSPFSSGVGFNYSGLPRYQLWVDSSCNGYASDVGPSGLRFGDPAQAEGLAVGDDLCLGHDNRIYARIENRGTAPAIGVRVHFDVGDPGADKGPCSLENCPFQEIGVADTQRFPALASLAPGAQATVYVPYNPPASQDGPSFISPALRVRVDPLQGEISIGDNVAYSEFGRVQAIVGNPPDIPVRGPDLLYTNRSNPMTVFLNSAGNLPRGISVSTGQIPARVDLGQGQQLDVPITFTFSHETGAAAGRYAANITISSFTPVPEPLYPRQRSDYRIIAAQTIGIDVVEQSRIDLRAVIPSDLPGIVNVTGQLHPNRNKELIAIDYVDVNQARRTALVRTGGDGKFETQLITTPGTGVSALWAGDEKFAPAAAGPVMPER
jgi:hypothetical protein